MTHGNPSGKIAKRRPDTDALRMDHSWGVGQHGSEGLQKRRRALCGDLSDVDDVGSERRKVSKRLVESREKVSIEAFGREAVVMKG